MNNIFSTYKPPFDVKIGEISISVSEENGVLIYRRQDEDDIYEKMILNGSSEILINPIEPVNLPKSLSPFLLIELEKPLVVSPKSKRKIFLTFPIEIGVFVSDKGFRVLDILSFNNEKFTLYGPQNNGLICRYWKSEVFTYIPQINSLHEGAMEIDINNDINEWTEITQIVFNAYGMKIYHGDGRLSMKSNMKIQSKSLAETSFTSLPTTSLFKRSVELYTARKLAINVSKCIMEHGL